MALWRVTCPLEERYVIAASLADAIKIAAKNWVTMKDPTPLATGYSPLRCEQVHASDPWAK